MDQFRPREDRDPVRDIREGVEDVRAMFEKFFRGRGAWLIGLIALGLYLASGFYIVGPGEKGVVLLFGKVYALTDSGLRYRLPKPIMTNAVVDIATVHRTEIGYRLDKGQQRPVHAESLMLTGDENIVDVQLIVQYFIQDPVKFLFGAQGPESALRASAEVALRGAVGEKTIDVTMTKGRDEIQQRVETYLQKLLDAYDTGLKVTQARLLVVDPPAQVQQAFHDVVRAWEDRDRLFNEAEGYREDLIPKARGQAQQEILEAEAYKAQRVIRARGDAERFLSVLAEYSKAPAITRERLYLESAEHFLLPARKFIMDSERSGILPVLPLMGRQEGSSVVSPGTRPAESSSQKKGN
jgi:modulator of FtsH protease HflK